MYEKPVNAEVKKIFTDLLFGNLLKNYRIKSDEFPDGVTIQENKDYKDALFKYNIILDYVRDLESSNILNEVIESNGLMKFNEAYYLTPESTHKEAFEQYKMDKFGLTLKEVFGFTIDGKDVDEEDDDQFEQLENGINKIYNTFLKKLKNQNKR